jgi:hypothetical protein
MLITLDPITSLLKRAYGNVVIDQSGTKRGKAERV